MGIVGFGVFLHGIPWWDTEAGTGHGSWSAFTKGAWQVSWSYNGCKTKCHTACHGGWNSHGCRCGSLSLGDSWGLLRQSAESLDPDPICDIKVEGG